MANLAIKGHPTRGKEVIQLLEMLGGRIMYTYNGDDDAAVYFIDGLYIMAYKYKEINCEKYKIFTLEEFLEKFPYKVGDKVKAWINGYRSVCNIRDMSWDGIVDEIEYKIQDYWYNTMNLQPYKEEGVNLQELERKLDEALAKETTESLNKWLDGEPEPEPKAPILSNRYDYAEGKCGYVIPDCYEFDYIKEGFQTEIILKPKKPTYPKTYVECAKILDCFSAGYIDGYKNNLLEKLQELLICRDAYWKIAGEQMGLGKPWKPDWNDVCDKYTIYVVYGNEIWRDIGQTINTLLAFPTMEMRDAFFENFKGLIEQCKELL